MLSVLYLENQREKSNGFVRAWFSRSKSVGRSIGLIGLIHHLLYVRIIVRALRKDFRVTHGCASSRCD